MKILFLASILSLFIFLVSCGRRSEKPLPAIVPETTVPADPYASLKWEFVAIPKDIYQPEEDRTPINLLKNWQFIIDNKDKFGIDLQEMTQVRATVLFVCVTGDIEFFDRWFASNYLLNHAKMNKSELIQYLGNQWKTRIQKMQ